MRAQVKDREKLHAEHCGEEVGHLPGRMAFLACTSVVGGLLLPQLRVELPRHDLHGNGGVGALSLLANLLASWGPSLSQTACCSATCPFKRIVLTTLFLHVHDDLTEQVVREMELNIEMGIPFRCAQQSSLTTSASSCIPSAASRYCRYPCRDTP